MSLTREDREKIRRVRDIHRRRQLARYSRGIRIQPADTYVHVALHEAGGDGLSALNMVLDVKGDRELPVPRRNRRR